MGRRRIRSAKGWKCPSCGSDTAVTGMRAKKHRTAKGAETTYYSCTVCAKEWNREWHQRKRGAA